MAYTSVRTICYTIREISPSVHLTVSGNSVSLGQIYSFKVTIEENEAGQFRWVHSYLDTEAGETGKFTDHYSSEFPTDAEASSDIHNFINGIGFESIAG